MTFRKAAAAVKRMAEQGNQELLQNGLPADRVKNQLPGRALPPTGNTGTGYTPGDTSVTEAKIADGAVTPAKLSFDPATQAELDAHAADTTAVHGIADTSTLYRAGGTDVALADGGTGASLTDPNADRILFWDDSAGQLTWLTPGTNLTITGTTIDAAGGGMTDPTTTLGDLLINDGSGVDRLGVGSDGDVLTADSGEALGVKWAAPSGGGGGDMVKLAAVDLASPAATIDFASIPNTYRALRIVIQGRITAAVADAFVLVQLNGDTGANYHDVYAYSGGGAGTTTNQTSGKIALFAGSSAPADSAGMVTIDIPFYAQTTFQKTLRATGADMYATNTLIQADFAVRWLSTAAINQVTFLLASGNFDTGSQATLYGLA